MINLMTKFHVKLWNGDTARYALVFAEWWLNSSQVSVYFNGIPHTISFEEFKKFCIAEDRMDFGITEPALKWMFKSITGKEITGSLFKHAYREIEEFRWNSFRFDCVLPNEVGVSAYYGNDEIEWSAYTLNPEKDDWYRVVEEAVDCLVAESTMKSDDEYAEEDCEFNLRNFLEAHKLLAFDEQ